MTLKLTLTDEESEIVHDSELDKLTVIQCDNGSEISQFRELFAQTGVKVINSIPHQPKTNGIVERMNREQMIPRWLMVNKKKSWVDALGPAVKAMSTTKSFVHKQFSNKIEDQDPEVLAHLNKKIQQLYGNRSDFVFESK